MIKLAHIEDIFNSPLPTQVSSLPVYGNFYTALIALVFVIAILSAAYFIIGRLPLSKKDKLTPWHEVALAKLTVTFILAGSAAAGWDVWWHRAVGRDRLFEPPHIFLYTFASIAILLSIYGWYRTHKKSWKKIAGFISLIPISAPFDNFWHIMFGVEDLSKPVSLSWSPPHMLLDIGAMMGLIMLVPILMHERKETQRSFFIDLAFAAVMVMGLFLVMPFHPTEGWGQVAGFWGTGVFAAVIISVMIYSQKILSGSYDVVRITMYSLILMSISYGKETAPGIILMPHDRQPFWLYVFAFMVSAIILDIFFKKLNPIARGAFAAGAWAAILFIFSPMFLDPQFYYPISESAKTIISSIAGGGLAGFLISKIHKA